MIMFRRSVAIGLALALFSAFAFHSSAQRRQPSVKTADDQSVSEMRPIIEYYAVDRGSLQRSYRSRAHQHAANDFENSMATRFSVFNN